MPSKSLFSENTVRSISFYFKKFYICKILGNSFFKNLEFNCFVIYKFVKISKFKSSILVSSFEHKILVPHLAEQVSSEIQRFEKKNICAFQSINVNKLIG